MRYSKPYFDVGTFTEHQEVKKYMKLSAFWNLITPMKGKYKTFVYDRSRIGSSFTFNLWRCGSMFHVQNTLPFVFFDTAKQNSDKTRETLGYACVS
jgi:hypothetical protein